MTNRYFRISQTFTEEEISSIMSALNYYAYNSPHIDEEKYNYAMSALEKVADAAEYGEI